jgi:tetratricopeptide (TPR) repeat protein
MKRLLLPMLLAAALFAQGESLLEQADEAFRQGNLDRAAVLARQALARDPRAVHGHMILGVIAAQKNQWETSTRHFEAVIRFEPSNPFGYFYLGQARLYGQQWEKAIQYFQKAEELRYPEPERLAIELAVALNEAGRPRQALAGLQAIAPPADARLGAQYHAVTAFAQARLNQPAPAIEAIRRALQIDEANAQYWDFLISELIQTDQSPLALAEAIRAQQKFPDHPDIQFLFALASYHVTESPLSGLALRNLREADPESPRVQLAEGLLYRKQGKTAEATAAFQHAAERGVPDAHLLLGILYKENGDYEAAEREYREAEKLNPGNGQVMLEMGKLLFARGELEQARIRFEKAAEFMPGAPAVHYQLGLVYRRLGQSEKAQYHLRLSKQQP